MAPLILGPTTSDSPTENVKLVKGKDSQNEVIMIGPLKLEIVEDGHNTDNRIGVLKMLVPPHSPGPAQHWHQMHDEIFFISKGTATFYSRNDKIVAEEGDTMVVPPCSPHTFGNETSEPVEILNTFTPAYYINYFRLMAEMATKGASGKVTPAIANRAMLQYATIQTGEDHDW